MDVKQMAMCVALVWLLAVLVAAEARPQEDLGRPARYNFDWAVEHPESGNYFGHREARDGDATTGHYYYDLPDGRRQMVTYRVDGLSGFVADVTFL